VVWPPVPTPGTWTATASQQFEDVAPAIPLIAGDEISVYLDSESGSSRSLGLRRLAVYQVDRDVASVAVAAGSCPILGDEVLVSSVDHDAFPGLAYSGGRWLVAYREGNGHVSTDGEIKTRVSTDDGVTWSSPTTILTGTHDHRGASLLKLSSGRIVIVCGARSTGGAQIQDGGRTAYTDDGGVSWSAFTRIDDGGFTSWSRAECGIVPLADDSWLLPIIGAETTGARIVRVLRSTDDGLTWSVQAANVAQSDDYSEPSIVRVGSTLIMLIRDSSLSSFGSSQWRSVSIDDGVTWSTPVEVLTGVGGKPQTNVRAVTGDIVAVVRDITAGYPMMLIRSGDLGETWEVCQMLPGANSKGVYGQAAEDDTGLLGVVYADEIGNSSTADADLYFRREEAASGSLPPGEGSGLPVAGFAGAPLDGKAYWGGTPPVGSTVESRYENPTGETLGIHRLFFQTSQTDTQMAAAAQAEIDAGRLPWISFKPGDWGDVTQGYLEGRIDAIKDVTGPVWLAVQHEPEDNVGALGSIAEWRTVQGLVRAAITAVGATNIAFAPILMGWTFNPASGRDPDDWWVDDIWDFFGTDCYRPAAGTIMELPQWDDMLDWIDGHGLKMGIAEWGIDEVPASSAQPADMQASWDYCLTDPRILSMVYYDKNAAREWELTGDGLTKFRAIMSDPNIAYIADL